MTEQEYYELPLVVADWWELQNFLINDHCESLFNDNETKAENIKKASYECGKDGFDILIEKILSL
jgi:hypothetical protein